jgi:N-acetyltransferase
MTLGPVLVPTILRGQHVTLEPLRRDHHDELLGPASEEDLWLHMGMRAHTREALQAWIDLRVKDVEAGTAVAFLTRDAQSRQAVGSTSLFDYAPAHRRIEIGHTWLAQSHRGTKANPEAKQLMLRHAFETLGLVRVQLKTDPLNARSRRAILKIGAQEEGILRNYTTYHDGTVHDRVFFSVLDREWPAVRARLDDLIGSTRSATGPTASRTPPGPR